MCDFIYPVVSSYLKLLTYFTPFVPFLLCQLLSVDFSCILLFKNWKQYFKKLEKRDVHKISKQNKQVNTKHLIKDQSSH